MNMGQAHRIRKKQDKCTARAENSINRNLRKLSYQENGLRGVIQSKKQKNSINKQILFENLNSAYFNIIDRIEQ